jgi:K+-transporting ATPase ATPase C chain
MLKHLQPAAVLLLIFTVLTGMVYPAIITGLAQLLFPDQANASLMTDSKGKTSGSSLIGQAFSDPRYFWGRPSATTPFAYNAAASSGSNLGPNNPALLDAVKARIAALQSADPDNKASIPVDLLTSSASGLDPHISPAAAQYQIERVAKARQLSAEKLRAIVQKNIEGRQWGFFGEARVNVLALNLALDALQK